MTDRQYIDDIKDFHRIIGAPIGEWPYVIPKEARKELRIDLMIEELNELIAAIEENDVVGVADGCADLIVVTLGTAIEYGFDFDSVWREVHRSNMAKVGGPQRADGKQLKPEGWRPPDIEFIVAKGMTCSSGCGDLGWTLRGHGRITHRHACPTRTDPFCQSHLKGCESDD
jgi:predicted HAD superfamily Cof-like phosphohydrolase